MKRGKITNFFPSVAPVFCQEKSLLEALFSSNRLPLRLIEHKWSSAYSDQQRGPVLPQLVQNNDELSNLDFWQERRQNDLG